jgi:acetoin utilization deacetylase AcuC-like enzyme
VTALLADPISKRHEPGAGHPESPARFDAVLRGLAEYQLTPFTPRQATEDELGLCHTRPYIRMARREVEEGFSQLSTGDTSVCHNSYEVALRAAGTVLHAVDLTCKGQAANAFCVVRPPGHHATTDRGMGFCLFNNVAVGARYAQKKHGLERVLIVDWDVHHGNGTQDIFYEDGSVLFFSTHQYPWYPGTGAADETGEGKGEGLTINCPLPSGSGRPEVWSAFQEKLIPAAEEFHPDLIMVSCGFDSRVGDPLGQFLLEDGDFADLTRVLRDIAAKHAGGRLVSVLEGGYNPFGLMRAAKAHASVLEE